MGCIQSKGSVHEGRDRERRTSVESCKRCLKGIERGVSAYTEQGLQSQVFSRHDGLGLGQRNIRHEVHVSEFARWLYSPASIDGSDRAKGFRRFDLHQVERQGGPRFL